MLKFILVEKADEEDIALFQNILCWSLSYRRLKRISQTRISKHLMLKFIPVSRHWSYSVLLISKHLMLKFIKILQSFLFLISWFQNILCWSLSCRDGTGIDFVFISKHLMLKFIATGMNIALAVSHFKTSYVEVYRISGFCASVVYPFQNILCWSLSATFKLCHSGLHISKHLMLKFI